MTRELKVYPNAHYYTEDGTFKMELAREAYFDLMRYHDYAIPDRFQTEDFWVKDLNTGDFAFSGLAGIFWFSDPDYNLSGHEMFLLPNQAIPEHWHVGTDVTGPKFEAWHVRQGDIFTCLVGVGEIARLSAPAEQHWMRAGPKGAIVTE
ncbi:hypothetical protein R3X27_22155 [Tropicimonas sp. TH_r6]|uniref:hypothetical protein n=1 Tax=Tropicimonas sp. TH_r6 TaxID=3082085 RepID=UPI002955DFCD|nr:hypothetical protein [Tropicimonas sp. TH_r6]MDV7145398.1 hypothetical protein [Tropicimonas sp. TH_r6]